MRNFIWIICLMSVTILNAQEADYTKLKGRYLGQKEPGFKPELFADGLVSIKEGIDGNIVFTPDFSEAAWHPNFKVLGKSIIYIMKYRNGQWGPPSEFYLTSGFEFSKPCYSYDGNKLYFLAGKVGKDGMPEYERICYTERKKDGWSDQKLLSHLFDTIPTHWQFSFDRKNNLYFSTSVIDQNAQIYCSAFRDGQYTRPLRLPETINSEAMELSPFISPDDDYLIFTRYVQVKEDPPTMKLYISFRDKKGNWLEAENLSEKLGTPAKARGYVMSAARVTPDGKYLFFTFSNGESQMAYWVDARIIDELRPKN